MTSFRLIVALSALFASRLAVEAVRQDQQQQEVAPDGSLHPSMYQEKADQSALLNKTATSATPSGAACLCDKEELSFWVKTADLRRATKDFRATVGAIVETLLGDTSWLDTQIRSLRITGNDARNDQVVSGLSWLAGMLKGGIVGTAANIGLGAAMDLFSSGSLTLAAAGEGSTHATSLLLMPFQVMFAPFITANVVAIHGQRNMEKRWNSAMSMPPDTQPCGEAYALMIASLAESVVQSFRDEEEAYVELDAFFEETRLCSFSPTTRLETGVNFLRSRYDFDIKSSVNFWSQITWPMHASLKTYFKDCVDRSCTSASMYRAHLGGHTPGNFSINLKSWCDKDRDKAIVNRAVVYTPNGHAPQCFKAWSRGMTWETITYPNLDHKWGNLNRYVFAKNKHICEGKNGREVQDQMARFAQMFTCQFAKFQLNRQNQNSAKITEMVDLVTQLVDSDRFIAAVRAELPNYRAITWEEGLTTRQIIMAALGLTNPFHKPV